MTFGPPEGPLPELSTTRVGGGLSARLFAVAVAGLLITVVGFTVVNRPPAPLAPSPTAPAVAVVPTAVPTAAPTPAPPRNQLEGNDGIFGWPVVAQLGIYSKPVDLVWPQSAQGAAYVGPRGGLFNRCRWGSGPQGAPPRGGDNEADCLGT